LKFEVKSKRFLAQIKHAVFTRMKSRRNRVDLIKPAVSMSVRPLHTRPQKVFSI